MSEVTVVVGLVVFVGGLSWSFAGNQVRGRIVGLAAAAVGALLTLAGAGPGDPTTWWMVGTSALTLIGLVWFALVLEAWTARAGEDVPVLDDEDSG